MTIEEEFGFVNRVAKGDSSDLEQLSNILGGTQATLDYFATVYIKICKGDPVKARLAALSLLGMKGILDRIDRQREGAKIISEIN